MNQVLVVGFRWLRHDIGDFSEQLIVLWPFGFFLAATAGVFFVATTAAAQITVCFHFTAFASLADRFGLAALTLSTCSLRSNDRHRLNHYYSDQTKINGGAN
ncbi:hypothetical protein [Rhodopirellula sp. P2]|uniref:hypothetical protein n=1 Tax=Rhodopirellula sp. P2 TaxID=2127060 RepID=UPI002367BC7D|nr:hypothetical protein [Rhodopirellula sp. P2]WDQ17057.1 hypothetical protein PSR62_00550 [Rhodopirellula sp. P2]